MTGRELASDAAVVVGRHLTDGFDETCDVVVVGSGAVAHRVVMRAQHNDFVNLNAACERNLDIGAGDASHLIVLTRHRTAMHAPLLRDIVRGRVQRVRLEHVAFADVSGKNLHMALQRRSQVGVVRSQHAIRSTHSRMNSAIEARDWYQRE